MTRYTGYCCLSEYQSERREEKKQPGKKVLTFDPLRTYDMCIKYLFYPFWGRAHLSEPIWISALSAMLCSCSEPSFSEEDYGIEFCNRVIHSTVRWLGFTHVCSFTHRTLFNCGAQRRVFSTSQTDFYTHIHPHPLVSTRPDQTSPLRQDPIDCNVHYCGARESRRYDILKS